MSDKNGTGQGAITEAEEEQGKLSFPCTIGIKAMGRQAEDFERTVIEIVAGHVGEESIIEVTCRESSGGKYHSVTCEVELQNRQEMEAIYQAMFDHPDILMTL
jgi:putative lipoic acid-binding regulatory protein